MFKCYKFKWKDLCGNDNRTEFFVHYKKTRNGFVHRACVIGALPRLDEKDNDWDRYKANESKLFAKRTAKTSYCNRTWETWPGQTCLSNLWTQLDKLKFVDMSQISPNNPFSGREEPEHVNLTDPDVLFDGLRR